MFNFLLNIVCLACGFVIFFGPNAKVVIFLGFGLFYFSGKVMIVMPIVCFF